MFGLKSTQRPPTPPAAGGARPGAPQGQAVKPAAPAGAPRPVAAAHAPAQGQGQGQAPQQRPAQPQQRPPQGQAGHQAAGAAPGALPRRPAAPAGSDAASNKISAYTFTDMYLPSDPLRPIMVRGLRSANVFIASGTKGLVRLPDLLTDDALRLQDTITRKWKHSNYAREFPITYEGCAYRCSLIAPPNFDYEEEAAENPAIAGKRYEWVVRQISAKIPTFEDIRLPQWAREDIDALTDMRGLVLIAGPFASGKTTLAAAAFNYWVAKSRDVGIALEDPPEIPMERTSEKYGKIIQIDLLDKSIRMAIKNSRRWSPRYVFLGEVRTSDVSAELMHMAISGPLTICTIHASDPVQAIVSLFRFTSEAMSEDMARAMIAASLHQVFHQEIVNGRARLRTAKLHGPDTHLMKQRITSGNFRGLYEDFERQAINRSKEQPGS